MKVLLVNPPARRFVRCQHPSFPLGLGYIASALRADDHEVHIYDAEWGADFEQQMHPVDKPLLHMALNWHRYFEALRCPDHQIWAEAAAVIREQAPDVLGITCRVLDLASARVLARLAKSVNPRMLVVFGGPATSTCTDLVLQDENVDFAVRGEGEITLVELLRAVEHYAGDFEAIRGLSFRRAGQVVHTEPRPLIKDISSLPYPDRNALLHTDLLPQRKVDYMMGELVTSRGCPYPCTFCAVRSVWGSPKVRLRTPEDVVGEILDQRDRFGARFFTLWDDLFTVGRKRTAAICNLLIERQADVRWLCLVRANTIDEELLDLMKRAGCVQVQMGVESGSDRILEKMRKGVTVEQILRATDMVRRVGIGLHVFLLIGIPGETREEMEATMRLVPRIDPDFVELSMFAPYPGSPLSDELLAAGKLDEQDWLTADFLNVDRCHTGTMSPGEFRELALGYIEQCDEHNAHSGQRPRRPSEAVRCNPDQRPARTQAATLVAPNDCRPG